MVEATSILFPKMTKIAPIISFHLFSYGEYIVFYILAPFVENSKSTDTR